VLESEGVDVDVVASIVGIRRMEIAFEGEADHAGTTPMNLQRDALVAAARTVDSVRRAADALAAEKGDYFVATVGVLDVSPSASNVVPGLSRLVIDARSTLTRDDATLRRANRPRERRPRQGGGRKAHALRRPLRRSASSLRSRSSRFASLCR